MIKNWTVITRAVKGGSTGIIVRERYLKSTNHPNHTRTESIFDVIGNEDTSKRILICGEKYRLKQQTRTDRRGRPLTSYAMEFCLTLPKPYRPTEKQWRAIIAECCKALADHLKLNQPDRRVFYSLIRGVCHQQSQTDSKGAGDHVHLIVSKVVNDRVLTSLQKKGATNTLKHAFTTAVEAHVGFSVNSYSPNTLNQGKRLEKWQYEASKLESENIEHTKLLAKLERQIRLWKKAIADKDDKKAKRQERRIEKNIDQIKHNRS